MANQVEKLNAIAIADIEAINGLNDAAIEAINGLEFVSAFGGITWSTDDVFPVTTRSTVNCGVIGAKLNSDTDGGTSGTQFRSYEHNGSSWASGVATGGRTRSSGNGGGTQGAAVMEGGYDNVASSDGLTTEEYNGSSWSFANNLVGGSAYSGGGGTSQTAQLISGGSNYNPTVRNITLTQTYNGTNWSNESVASHGAGAGTNGEAAGGGLDAFMIADGSREDPPNSNANLISQIFNQSAGSWTTKATVTTHTWYNCSSTDGTRVYKIAGMGGTSVESWEENSWTNQSVLPASVRQGGLGTGGTAANGGATHVGGSLNSNNANVTTYYTAAAS